MGSAPGRIFQWEYSVICRHSVVQHISNAHSSCLMESYTQCAPTPKPSCPPFYSLFPQIWLFWTHYISEITQYVVFFCDWLILLHIMSSSRICHFLCWILLQTFSKSFCLFIFVFFVRFICLLLSIEILNICILKDILYILFTI